MLLLQAMACLGCCRRGFFGSQPSLACLLVSLNASTNDDGDAVRTCPTLRVVVAVRDG